MKQLKSSIKPYAGAAAVMLAVSMQQNALALPPIKIGDVDVGTIDGLCTGSVGRGTCMTTRIWQIHLLEPRQWKGRASFRCCARR